MPGLKFKKLLMHIVLKYISCLFLLIYHETVKIVATKCQPKDI